MTPRYTNPHMRRRNPNFKLVTLQYTEAFLKASQDMLKRRPSQFLQFVGMVAITAAAAIKLTPVAALIAAGATIATIMTAKPERENKKRANPLQDTVPTARKKMGDVTCFVSLCALGAASVWGVQTWNLNQRPELAEAKAAITSGLPLIQNGNVVAMRNMKVVATNVGIKERGELPAYQRPFVKAGVVLCDVPLSNFNNYLTGQPITSRALNVSFGKKEVTIDTRDGNGIQKMHFMEKRRPKGFTI